MGIRQLTLDGPEGGLLLLRVRDEVRITVDAYKVLYDSSVTFGVRKQLQAEQGSGEPRPRAQERRRGRGKESVGAQGHGRQEAQGRDRLPQVPGPAPRPVPAPARAGGEVRRSRVFKK